MIILYKKINIIENYNHLCYKLKVVGRFLELLTRSCRLFRCSLSLSSCVACYCRDLCICLLYDAFFYCLHRSCVGLTLTLTSESPAGGNTTRFSSHLLRRCIQVSHTSSKQGVTQGADHHLLFVDTSIVRPPCCL